MSNEYSMQVALKLIDRGILTAQAGRLMTYLQQHGVFCQPLQTQDGEFGIVWRDRWYTPLEFNAVADDRYPPTPDDIVASIRAMAAEPEPAPAPEPEPEPEPAPDPDTDPAPPAPGTPEAEAQLETWHQAASKRPGGAGALTWGLALLLGAFGAIAALGFWQVAQLIGSR